SGRSEPSSCTQTYHSISLMCSQACPVRTPWALNGKNQLQSSPASQELTPSPSTSQVSATTRPSLHQSRTSKELTPVVDVPVWKPCSPELKCATATRSPSSSRTLSSLVAALAVVIAAP